MHLKRLPKAHVTIRVKGQTLQEHLTERSPQDASTTTCFIESTSGSEFIVDLHLKRKFQYVTDLLICAIYLDGEFACSQITYLRPAGRNGIHDEISEQRSKPDSAGNFTSRTFKFAALETTDNNPTALDKKKAQDLGEIKVCVHRARVKKQQAPVKPIHAQPALSSGEEPIAEKALKGRALSSRAKLGEPEARSSGKPCVNVEYPWGSRPIATYIFKHRSRKDLQVEGIIERSASPVPLEDRNPEDLEPAEARELIRRMRDREEAAAMVKQEHQVKKERSDERRHLGSGNEGECEDGSAEINKSGKRQYFEIASDDEEDDEGEITMTTMTTKRARVIQSMANQDVVDLSDD